MKLGFGILTGVIEKKEKGKGDEKPTTKFVVGFTVYIFPYAFTNFVGIIITLSSFSK